ncbi:hypothetical protein HS088_TW08G00384 [Tripterygium wilfordii]|uniref:Uncharacterized protein n=1 Tax=Tripterygium wilfordii TaxID=458696 RepID=A0A7J7DCK0_TRIWF|nr:hypothetical protein HS088_TW08G00384 [Tripterygium wilfordii]
MSTSMFLRASLCSVQKTNQSPMRSHSQVWGWGGLISGHRVMVQLNGAMEFI